QFQIEPDGDDGCVVTTPQTRLDIQVGAADLIEELARVYGYDKLPESHLAHELPEQRGNCSLELEEKVRDLLADQGLQECITYSLSSAEAEGKLHASPPIAMGGLSAAHVALLNPISPERSVMRQTLAPGLLEVAARNLQTVESVALFEVGPVFVKDPHQALPREPRSLCIVLCGRRSPA